MERDFLGLSDKQYLGNVKREVNDDVVGERGLNKKVDASQWGNSKPFANSNSMHASDLQEIKVFSGTYQWGSVSAANVHRRGQTSGAFQPLLLGGSVPLTNHSPLVPRVSSSRSSHQLTILYGGTVSVFNDISPEKVQAIMLCARQGLNCETVENSLKKEPVRESERMYGKQIYNNSVAASSSSASPSESFSRCRDIKHISPTNAMSMIESFNATHGSMIPSVPQARKASLVRFLEKRKERLMSAMPYKKMLLDLSTGESCGMNYSSTSPA